MSKIQQLSGSNGQKQAANLLSSIGIEMVEEIGTPVKTLPVKHLPGLAYRKDIFRVIYGEKVSGDHHGLLPDGTSVLIETKTTDGGNLAWSHMRPHQPERLSRHASIGRAVSLLVWVRHPDIFVMRWTPDGIEGFREGKSIKPEQAKALHAEFIEFLAEQFQTSLALRLQMLKQRRS